MNKEDLVKLTEALGALGNNIKTFNYTVHINQINPEYTYSNFETEREIELKLCLPLIKSDTRP